MSQTITLDGNKLAALMVDRQRLEMAFKYLEWYRVLTMPLPIPNTDNVWQQEIPTQAEIVMHSALDLIDDYLRVNYNGKQESNQRSNDTNNQSQTSTD